MKNLNVLFIMLICTFYQINCHGFWHKMFHNHGFENTKHHLHDIGEKLHHHSFFKNFHHQKEKVKNWLHNNESKLKSFAHGISHKLPDFPFHHKPIFPFHHHHCHHHNPFFGNHPGHPMSFNPSEMHPVNIPQGPHPVAIPTNQPADDGQTEIHIIGQFTNVDHQNYLLGNGQVVPVDHVTIVKVELDFKVDNALLARMKEQFMKYHDEIMTVLGSTLGHFHGMMPLMQSVLPEHLDGLKRFPQILHKLMWLQEMQTRHEAFMKLLEEAKHNNNVINQLEEKLEVMKKNFGNFEDMIKQFGSDKLDEGKEYIKEIKQNPKVTEMIQKMKDLHSQLPLKYDEIKDSIKDKKEMFSDNLNKMSEKIKEHQSIFDAAKDSLDKLPGVFSHFKNLMSSLGGLKDKIKLPENHDEEKEEESHHENVSDKTIIETKNAVEESAITGVEDDSSSASSSSSSSSSNKSGAHINSNQADNENVVADDSEETDNDEDNAKPSDIASVMNDHLDRIQKPSNAIVLDDGLLDRLQDEQKDFEVTQHNQNSTVDEFKQIDNGLFDSARDRRSFTSRFIRDLNDNDNKPYGVLSAPAVNHLSDLSRYFEASREV